MSQCDNTTKGQQCCEKSDSTNCLERLEETPCPVDISVEKWQSAFFEAMQEKKVEYMKERIEKSWGPLLGKQADAVLESMSAYWQGMLLQAKSQCDLREKVKESLCEEGCAK